MPQLKIIPMCDWTEEMYKISSDISNGIEITYETNCKYVIILESDNIKFTSVYFIKED